MQIVRWLALGVLASGLAACTGAGGGQTVSPPIAPQGNAQSIAGPQASSVAQAVPADIPSQFNTPGDIVIADQFNNRTIEINRLHQIVWHFGTGSSVAGPTTIIGPNDAERFGTLTIMAGTGAPPGTEPTCPMGCVDNRVIIVNRAGQIVWQYGHAGVTGAGFDQLNTPVSDVPLPNGNILITDQGNERVIEVTRDKRIVWQYGKTGVMGNGFDELNNPNMAELLANGRILIADENNNRVIEVNRDHQILWSFGGPGPSNTNDLSGAAFASRLPNGNTLITDSNHNRALEITSHGIGVWVYYTNRRPGSIAMPLPTRAVRLKNGDTLISDQFNHQVIEVNHAKQIVFSQGKINRAGTGFDELNAPYDAKVIGDFTGLTPPPPGF